MIERILNGIKIRLNTAYLEHKDELDTLANKVIYTGSIGAYFYCKLGILEYCSVRLKT